MTTLGEALPLEMARVRDDVMPAYQEIGVAGAFALAGMRARIRHRAGFPARMQRWCTRELKIEPLREYHDRIEAAEGRETACVMGIRASESATRAKMPAFFDEPEGARSWGGWVWRPILSWTVADVLAIHHRHGIEVNPLYRLGHERVGCWPCVYSSKEQIRLIAEQDPGRIDEIRELERWCVELRKARNAERPGRYAHPDDASFFRSRTSFDRTMTIDEVVAWSRTTRGGRQYPLLPPAPTGGCVRWGMCDPPSDEADEPATDEKGEPCRI